MHPIVAEHIAADRRSRQLEAAVAHRRRARAASARVWPTAHWRARQARRLVALARRLDPAAGSLAGPAVPVARR